MAVAATTGSAPPPKRGQLCLILGPMGAGKTSHAAWRFSKYGRDARNVLVWLHNPLDTRAQAAEAVNTHNGPLKIAGLYLTASKSAATGKPDLAAVWFPPRTTHVFVDEVQFYDRAAVRDVILDKWVRQLGLTVFCIGLLTNKDREIWPSTQLLLLYADKITFLHAKCSCGMAAGHTRAVSSAAAEAAGGQICVGGMKEYEAACINCHPAQ